MDIISEDNKPSEQKMFPIFYKETAQTNCFSPSHNKQKGKDDIYKSKIGQNSDNLADIEEFQYRNFFLS